MGLASPPRPGLGLALVHFYCSFVLGFDPVHLVALGQDWDCGLTRGSNFLVLETQNSALRPAVVAVVAAAAVGIVVELMTFCWEGHVYMEEAAHKTV